MEIPASLLMTSGMYAYVVVKSSVHASDTSVFGLNNDEVAAISQRYPKKIDIENGMLFKATPIQMINALGQLGYHVVASTGEAEVTWTMQRDR